MTKNFSKDEQFGRSKENQVILTLLGKEFMGNLIAGYYNSKPLGLYPSWDAILLDTLGRELCTLEVKSERKATKYIFLEVACNNRKSGIFRSSADYIIYLAEGESIMYIMNRAKLIEELCNYGKNPPPYNANELENWCFTLQEDRCSKGVHPLVGVKKDNSTAFGYLLNKDYAMHNRIILETRLIEPRSYLMIPPGYIIRSNNITGDMKCLLEISEKMSDEYLASS